MCFTHEPSTAGVKFALTKQGCLCSTHCLDTKKHWHFMYPLASEEDPDSLQGTDQEAHATDRAGPMKAKILRRPT